MLEFAYNERINIGEKFSFLDLGCGNGWVVRKVQEHNLCNKAVGIDGAYQMIKNARKVGGKMIIFLLTSTLVSHLKNST